MTNITPKQEKFAQIYVETGNASEAYRQAYSSKAKPETVYVKASELLSSGKVSVRVRELQDEMEEKALWRRINSLKVLSDIALEGEKDSDRVSAVKALNSMHGWDRQTIDHTSSDGSMSPSGKTLKDFYADENVSPES